MPYVSVSVKPTDRWLVGLSTEEKPIPEHDLARHQLMESDTGNEYRWTGTQWIPTAAHGAQNIHDSHVHHTPVNNFFHQHAGVETTLASVAPAQAIALVLVDSTGFSVGDTVHIGNGTRENTEPRITAINTPIHTITLDRPIDSEWAVGTEIVKSQQHLNVLGTLQAPQSFKANVPQKQVWHVQSFVINMIFSTSADDGKFGNLAALTNGVILRGYNATYDQHFTFTNWKTNGDIKLDMLDVVYTDRAGGGGGGGDYGLTGDGDLYKRTGAVPELNGNAGDYLEILVQDDLTDLNDFQVKVQGHTTDT